MQVPPSKRRRGATLLVSLGILTLLSVFAIAFVRLVSFERVASANYVDGVRARMLARAGIERATIELRELATQRHFSQPTDPWRFRYTSPDTSPANLITTTSPSYRMTDPTVTYRGQPLAFSGNLGASYQNGRDVYKLKVIDAASQFNVNHPDRMATARALATILQMCGELDSSFPVTNQTRARELALAVVNRRPATRGFDMTTRVLDALVAVDLANEGQWRLVWSQPSGGGGSSTAGGRPPLRDMLTVKSWVDPSVIRPWRLAELPTGATSLGAGTIVGVRDLPPMPRSPVNLNTATYPVLVALFHGLRSVGNNGTFEIDLQTAKNLAQAIRVRVNDTGTGGGPFRTWAEFETWLDAEAIFTGATPIHSPTATDFPGGSWLAGAGPIHDQVVTTLQGCRDLIKAMLNPNTMNNKFGILANHGGSRHPEFRLPRLVDKADLTQITTEGCFDAMGVYEITAAGLVLAPSARAQNSTHEIVAAQTEQVVVKLYDVFRITTQADFEANRALMATGDFLDALDRNWQYDTSGGGAVRAPFGLNRPAFEGFVGWPGVLSYPNYSLRRSLAAFYPPDSSFPPAQWDGHLELSNLIAHNQIRDWDFVAGFARGSFQAFKVRAWWDPKDQNPFPDPNETNETKRINNPAAGKELTPTHGITNVTDLATPRGIIPDLNGKESQRAELLDTTPGVPATSPGFFFEGSALTNNGVLIHPERDRVGGGSTRAPGLVYHGDNLNLNNGFSIQFWHMATEDPAKQPAGQEQVLFSWVGAKGIGSAPMVPPGNREIGFKVVKNHLGGGVVEIRLKTVPGNLMQGIDDPSIDVTPGVGSVAPDPSNPQWLPGSWHWIVVNAGAFAATSADPSQVLSLQIDRKKAVHTRILDVPNENPPYGEAHAYMLVWTWPPLAWRSATISFSNWNVSGLTAYRSDRLLGDWYHCDEGVPVEVEQHEEVHASAIVYDADSGDYVVADGTTIPPFPPGSFDHEMILRFNGQRPVPEGGTSSGTTTWNQPMSNTGGSDGIFGWTYSFGEDDMGPDTEPGTSDDPTISLVRRWKTSSTGSGSCACCGGCNHCFEGKGINFRWNTSTGQPGGMNCGVVWKSTVSHGNRLPQPNPIPVQYVCDQCNGCEACDVDGPMYWGGDPGASNLTSGGASIAAPEKATMARGLFDNLVIKGNTARRADWPGAVAGTFQDRFFESNLSIAASTAQLGGQQGYGATYRRVLAELQGTRARLGTLSWTSYRSTEGSLEFGLRLRRLPGGNGTRHYFDPNQRDIHTLGADIGTPYTGPLEIGGAGGTGTIGLSFRADEPFDASSDPTAPTGSPYPRQQLLLTAELTRLGAARDNDTSGGLPSMILETPVLEDVTLTLIGQPQLLYAEGGVEE